MPIYEYKCDHCGYQVDYFQSYSELPKTDCPTCHGHLSRMVTKGAGLIFKGSGFYETDYKKHDGRDNGNGKHILKKESDNTNPADKTSVESKTETSKPVEKPVDKNQPVSAHKP